MLISIFYLINCQIPDEVLRLARNKFENLGYKVYFTGAKYNYKGEEKVVESNEYLVAIKDNQI